MNIKKYQMSLKQYRAFYSVQWRRTYSDTWNMSCIFMSVNFMSVIFMSVNFMPGHFDGPSFSCPSFSAPPFETCRENNSERRRYKTRQHGSSLELVDVTTISLLQYWGSFIECQSTSNCLYILVYKTLYTASLRCINRTIDSHSSRTWDVSGLPTSTRVPCIFL